MDIIECSPEMDIDRMFCPSTGEVIFAPSYESINDDAVAFVACWDSSNLSEPTINDELLKSSWEKYYNDNLKGRHDYIWEDFRNFLKSYENPQWIVYECDYYGMACGPTGTTLVFVVKVDTLIEVDPDFEGESEGNTEQP